MIIVHIVWRLAAPQNKKQTKMKVEYDTATALQMRASDALIDEVTSFTFTPAHSRLEPVSRDTEEEASSATLAGFVCLIGNEMGRPMPTAAELSRVRARIDVDGNGLVSESEARVLIVEMFDEILASAIATQEAHQALGTSRDSLTRPLPPWPMPTSYAYPPPPP